MLDERLLARVLARSAQEAPASALDEVMHLAQSAKYDVAAQRAAELLESGCKDVRAFIAYALGVFAEAGPATLPLLFEPIGVILSQRDDGSRPTARATDTALRFFFRILKAHLDFDERRPAAARQAWTRHVRDGSTAAVLDACNDLRKTVHALLDEPRCDAELGTVIGRLEAYFHRLGTQPPQEPRSLPEPEPAEPAVRAAPPAQEVDADSVEEREPGPPQFARRASDHRAEFEPEPMMPISPALQQFIQKLQAFEQLVEGGSLAKAAIVAHDVRQIVANFDPRVYLPNLLSPHFRLLSRTIEELSPYWEQAETPGWEALEQLYRVDLDAFVES